MARPDRYARRGPTGGGGAAPKARREESGAPTLASSVQALDAKIRLISQRIKIMEGSEQVVGRTLVSVTKKIKELEAMIEASGGVGGGDIEGLREQLLQAILPRVELKIKDELATQIKPTFSVQDMHRVEEKVEDREEQLVKEEVAKLQRSIDQLRTELEEIKYVVDTLNPMEYITLDNINEILNHKINTELDKRMKKRDE